MAVAVSVTAVGCRDAPIPQLPALDAKIDATSVSGISSGAYMAGQFQIAESRLVVGAAIIAGGPYGCAESVFADLIPGPGQAFLNLSKAINGCMLNALQLWGVPNPSQLADKARRFAEKGEIDPLDDVRDDRIYLFSGREDSTVVPAIVHAAAEFYVDLGVPRSQIEVVTRIAAGHAFVTEDKGEACDSSGKPYLVDCDYDQAGALLTHIYGSLQPRAARAAGRYLEFDQNPFTDDMPNHGMGDTGVVYVPPACLGGADCRVHIAFHGCGQNRSSVGDVFVKDTGFARWADTNRLIVLFPQVAATPLNPQACWDWWGYTGSGYLTNQAPQIVAVRKMLERLAGSRASS